MLLPSGKPFDGEVLEETLSWGLGCSPRSLSLRALKYFPMRVPLEHATIQKRGFDVVSWQNIWPNNKDKEKDTIVTVQWINKVLEKV